MLFRKSCQFLHIALLTITGYAWAAGYPYPGQTVQINTHFHTIYGNSIWTLILRDPISGRVIPYQYFFREDNNTNQFNIAFSTSPTYVILESKLQWGPYAEINNVCGLVDGVVRQQSLSISMGGDLSPNRRSFTCQIMRYNSVPFTIGD